MNIHPLFVHFPIGLLVIYVLLELLPSSLERKYPWLRNTKIFLLIMGTGAGFFALGTGDMAGEIVGENALVETHAAFAGSTIVLFSSLTVIYLFDVLRKMGILSVILRLSFIFKGIILWLEKIARALRRPWIVGILAIVGFMLISITGGLGASIAYGPDIDPLVGFIYHLFF